jgi:hypothetical protein
MCKRYIPEIYVTLAEFRKPVKAGWLYWSERFYELFDFPIFCLEGDEEHPRTTPRNVH